MIDGFFPWYLLAFIMTFTLTAVFLKRWIPYLAGRAKQPIYEEGPSWHKTKAGTPTMGGLSFLTSSLIVGLSASVFLSLSGNIYESISLLLTLGFAFMNAVVGIVDDLTKLRRKENAGLTPLEKLLFQTALATVFVLLRMRLFPDATVLRFSFGGVDIGYFYLPLSVFLLLGIINCANLTDGIDGLASGVAFGVGISFFYLSCALSYDVTFVSTILMGSAMAFLIFNLHPAKIFMGDTGSLFFGALGAGCAFSLGNPLLLLPIGIVYILEGWSVILQVVIFKATGKRVFLMAPLHHHFEKRGWSENKIVICAILLTVFCAALAYIFYLP